ncbi:MAG: hypothetical protein NTZ05_17925 [Chloroflexi bacterium]|nr:hypothetical protein [Chloroflexota bacterium]
MRARFWAYRPAPVALSGKASDLAIPANQLERLKDDLERQNQQISAEVASLRSLAYAEDQARSRWRMAPPEQTLYVDLDAPSAPAAAAPTKAGR